MDELLVEDSTVVEAMVEVVVAVVDVLVVLSEEMVDDVEV